MSVRSLLSAYLRAQRDLGVEEFIFGHGSQVNSIISEDGSSRENINTAKSVLSNAGRERAVSAGSEFNSGAARVPARPNLQTQTNTPFSKLSKIKPVETFNYVKTPATVSVPASSKTSPQHSEKREKLALFYRETINCDKCELSKSRSKVIFGTGSAGGKLLVLGESLLCAADENAGLPFQGEAGELYYRILDKMGLDKSTDVFTTYLQKCRGSNNEREFNKECAVVCRSLLDRQIEIIAPKALLVFGQSAANILLNNDYDIERLRSSNHTYKEIPVIVTYSIPLMSKEPHLRNGAWEDLKKVLNIL